MIWRRFASHFHYHSPSSNFKAYSQAYSYKMPLNNFHTKYSDLVSWLVGDWFIFWGRWGWGLRLLNFKAKFYIKNNLLLFWYSTFKNNWSGDCIVFKWTSFSPKLSTCFDFKRKSSRVQKWLWNPKPEFWIWSLPLTKQLILIDM